MKKPSVATGAVALMLALVLAGVASGRVPSTPTLRFHVFARTTQHMDSILWTGTQFLYVQNTANTVWAAPPAGHPVRQFATMPMLVEETRCIRSPGRKGFPPDVIFCHSPDNKIYEISPDGSSVTVFATLPAPYPPAADGALAFDSVGRFGYRLVAATGRSGGAQPAGGLVYTIDAHGTVRQLGSYPGPGGADELVIAPREFGPVAGDALLSVDAGASGAVVAVDPSGRTRTIATFPKGASPIAPITQVPAGAGGTRGPAPGFYLTDDTSSDTYMAPAAPLAPYTGDVIVGTESGPFFWILEPRGGGFAKISLRNNLPAGAYEQGIFVSN